jgi:4-hydroxy-tetrahydrodipicolinate synthase
MSTRIRGVLAPVVTPFGDSGAPDSQRLLQQCLWLQQHRVGLAVFGTNSEANSLSVEERIDLLDRLIEGGVARDGLMPGTGCCAIPDSVRLTTHAVSNGVAGCLMLPPFYYKGVSTEGLYRNFATIIERVGDARLRIYLYHIPPVSQVPIGFDLIERLLRDFPGTIAGIKDSSGDWNHTQQLLARFGSQIDVFPGSESFLLAALRNGGAGCISATANVNPAALAELARRWNSAEADALQARADVIRAIFQKRPMIAAMKCAIAHSRTDAAWVRVRPPLVELPPAERAALIDELSAAGFSLPPLASQRV